MKRINQLVLISILLSTAVGLARGYLVTHYPWLEPVAVVLLLTAVVVWIVANTAGAVWNILHFGRGRYAVLAFVLDPELRLLLVRHPFHRRLIPPGGRLHMWELPHEAVPRVLSEEAGLKEFGFDERFHAPKLGYTDTVTVLPAPHCVQKEDRKQRRFIRFHYAFVYVLTAGVETISSGMAGYTPKWYSWEEIASMTPPDRPFDDVVKRYSDILSHIRGIKKVA